MGEKDLSEKILMDYNDVFADIINVLLFNGEKLVKPDALTLASVHSQYKADTGKLHELERDVSKYWMQHGVKFAMYGLENQTKPERNMPFRVIGYDGASYRQQLLKNETPVPVITIVLHFGVEHRWNYPRSIKELMNVPDYLDKYVNDYHIHVFDIAWLSDEQLAMFQSDFSVVANYLAQVRKTKDYRVKDLKVLKHVDEVLKIVSVLTPDPFYQELLNSEERKGIRTMYDVTKKIEQRGFERGMEKRAKSIAVNLIKAGMKNDFIAQTTDLSESDIESLRQSVESEKTVKQMSLF